MTTRPLARRTRVVLAAAGILAVGAAVALPIAASAHTPDFQVSCTSASIDLTNYPSGSTVSGTLDGDDLGTVTFGPERYHGHTALDPSVPHTWNVVVTSGDGDHRYDRTFAGTSDPACLPVIETPTPTPEPTTPAPTPVDVVTPMIQDYITCDGAAFVLDNTGSTVPVRYVVAGKPFDVPAGTAVHTDADGYLFPTDIGPYTITTTPGDKSWTFTPPSGCAPATTPTPTPTDQPTPNPTDEPSTEPTTPAPTPTEEPTTSPTPTTEPSVPATPSEQPTAPSPTAGTSQPSSSPAAPAPSSSSTQLAASVADDTSHAELAYTGSALTSGQIRVLLAAVVLAIGAGATVLTVRTIRRRRDIE